jgi:hypothetical protein
MISNNLNEQQFFENLASNALLDLWQRGTSFASSAAGYKADRFFQASNGALVTTVSRSTNVPTNLKSNYSIRVEVTTADASVASTDHFEIKQRVEGFFAKKVYNKKSFFSVYVRTNKIGTYHLFFNNNTVGGRSFTKSFTINNANTWTKITVKLPKIDTSVGTWNTSNSTGIEFGICLVAGTNYQTANLGVWQTGYELYCSSSQVNFGDTIGNYFEMTQFKFHEGHEEIDDSKIFRNILQEIIHCQRYYEKSYSIDIAPGTAITTGLGIIARTISTGNQGVAEIFQVRKRGTPTMTFYNTSTGGSGTWREEGLNQNRTISNDTNRTCDRCFGASITGGTTGAEIHGHYVADAEL